MKMDNNATNSTLEEQCEYRMNEVVETRKKFGKMCVDYKQKAALVETKMLKLQLKHIRSCRFKAKNIPDVNTEDMTNDLDEFRNEILSIQRVDVLRQKVADMQFVVLQLKNDKIGQNLKKPITVNAMLAEAKRRLNK